MAKLPIKLYPVVVRLNTKIECVFDSETSKPSKYLVRIRRKLIELSAKFVKFPYLAWQKFRLKILVSASWSGSSPKSNHLMLVTHPQSPKIQQNHRHLVSYPVDRADRQTQQHIVLGGCNNIFIIFFRFIHKLKCWTSANTWLPNSLVDAKMSTSPCRGQSHSRPELARPLRMHFKQAAATICPRPFPPPWAQKRLAPPSRRQRSSSFPRPTCSHAHRYSRLTRQHSGKQSSLVTLTFDLLILKVVTWATSVPILVFLGLSVLC